MSKVESGIEDTRAQAATALKTVEGDPTASPVLAAVVRQFVTKADKARETARDAKREREAVIELEQAADSAKATAAADTKTAVIDAHNTICVLKASLDR